MIEHADFVTGWIDTTIHDFLLEIEEPWSSTMNYALVTCLDSNFDVSSALLRSKHLRPLIEKCEPVSRGILLTTRQLLAAERHNRIFFGFDEVWFFPNRAVQPKPKHLVITGPDRVNQGEIEEHSEWIRSTNCSLGLGDGEGMNFFARVRGVAKYVVRALNETNPQERETA